MKLLTRGHARCLAPRGNCIPCFAKLFTWKSRNISAHPVAANAKANAAQDAAVLPATFPDMKQISVEFKFISSPKWTVSMSSHVELSNL